MLKNPPAPIDSSIYSKVIDVNNLGQPLGNGTIPSVSEKTYQWWSKVGKKLQQAQAELHGIEMQQHHTINEFDFRAQRNLLIAKHAMLNNPDQRGVIDHKNRTIDWNKIGVDPTQATKAYEEEVGEKVDTFLNYETDLNQKLKDEAAKIEDTTRAIAKRQYKPPPPSETRGGEGFGLDSHTEGDDPTRGDPTDVNDNNEGTTEDMDVDVDNPVEVETSALTRRALVVGQQEELHTEDRVWDYVDHMINEEEKQHLLGTGDFEYPEDVMTYDTNSGLFASELVHLNHGGVFPI
jgi:hypothetical protein